MALENLSFSDPYVIGAAVALLIGVLTFARVKKDKKVIGFKRNGFAWFFLVVGVFLIVAQAGYISDYVGPFGATLATAPTGAVATQPVATGICPPGSVEDVTVTLSGVDAMTGGASGGTHRYHINGNPALTVSDAGTFTASGGDVLKILYTNASTSGSYYGALKTVTLDCAKGTQTVSEDLYRNGSLTINIFNEEKDLIKSGTVVAETLGAGDTVTLEATIQGQFERGYPYGGVLILDGYKAAYDKLIADFGDTNPVSVPDVYGQTNGTSMVKAYNVPPIISNEILSGTIYIDVDDASDPTTVQGNITVTFYPNNYFIGDGGLIDGPATEDEDDVGAGLGPTGTSIWVD